MTVFTDQMGRKINLEKEPKRIVSLVPSQTELLYALGLKDQIVGITHFCIHPKEKPSSVTKVGGTKKLNHSKIAALKPDLIIANKEENTQADVEKLAQDFPVWVSYINHLGEAPKLFREIGLLVRKTKEAENLTKQLEFNIAAIKNQFAHLQNKKTAYFIWNEPLMVCAEQTFIHSVLSHLGLENVFAGQTRYPETDFAQLKQLQPQLILLSSEPYPFAEKHIQQFKQELPNSEVILVDGEIFSWYGTRLLQMKKYFSDLALI